MSIVAYDSASPKHIPANPPAVLCYADGHYRWPHTMFPKALFRYVTVQGNPYIPVLDVEPGCVWPPSKAEGWVTARQKLGLHDAHVIYCSKSSVAAVREAMKGHVWRLILSTLDGSKPTEYDGIPLLGVQYSDHSNDYDETIIFDEKWLNRPTAP